MTSNMVSKLSSYLVKGAHVLDLGAGTGEYSEYLAALGMKVSAVDLLPRNKRLSKRIQWSQTDIRKWLVSSRETFDAALLRNVIQYYSSIEVVDGILQPLERLIKPQGLIAVQTFHEPPEPNFSKEFNFASYWHVQSFQEALPCCKSVFAQEFAEISHDRARTPRRFFITQVILRKVV